MGFMDKAKKMAEQAQAKLDEVQKHFNAAGLEQPPARAARPSSTTSTAARSTPAPVTPDAAGARRRRPAPPPAAAPACRRPRLRLRPRPLGPRPTPAAAARARRRSPPAPPAPPGPAPPTAGPQPAELRRRRRSPAGTRSRADHARILRLMRPCHGLLTAMVTPFRADGSVNEEAAVALGRHLLAQRLARARVGGTTGESATLTDEEQRRPRRA